MNNDDYFKCFLDKILLEPPIRKTYRKLQSYIYMIIIMYLFVLILLLINIILLLYKKKLA